MTPEERMRKALARKAEEKRMFGGVCFMRRGNMLCAASRRGFLFRVGKESDRAALALAAVTPMVMRGRALAGYVRTGLECDPRLLKKLLSLAERHVAKLPAKRKGASTRRRSRPG